MITYTITLEAPIGVKCGRLSADIADGKLTGCIFVMNAENPFSGDIDNNGNCTISGSLKSLLYQLSYVGSGTLTEDQVLLNIKTDRHTLMLKGEKADE